MFLEFCFLCLWGYAHLGGSPFFKTGTKKVSTIFFDKIVKSHVGVGCFIIFFTVNNHIDNVYIIYFILKVNSIFLFYYRVSLYLEKIRLFFHKKDLLQVLLFKYSSVKFKERHTWHRKHEYPYHCCDDVWNFSDRISDYAC